MIPELVLLAALAATPAQDRVLDAIRTVESSGNPNAVGDNGAVLWGDNFRSRGPYQIRESYWKDSGVAGSWSDCDKEKYARRVIESYMQRYCKQAWEVCDAEKIAKTHNGGPLGYKKKATEKYWILVKKSIGRLRKDCK